MQDSATGFSTGLVTLRTGVVFNHNVGCIPADRQQVANIDRHQGNDNTIVALPERPRA